MGKLCDALISPKFYAWIMSLMVGMMALLVVWSSWFRTRPGIVDTPLSNYDYIIVGGGTAGCVLASKLSSNSNLSVLLVEAGQQFSWLSSIPLAAPLLQGSDQDWAYVTRPQSHSSYGLWNQSSSWPRGRGLGGSAQMNFLIHYSGNEEDFSRWEKDGAVGWGPEDMSTQMATILGRETELPVTSCPNNYQFVVTWDSPKRCRVANAKVHLSRDTGSELGKTFVDAGKELGFDFYEVESTARHGQRWTSLDGFLRPVLHRPNLHVLLNAHVDKVLWKVNGRQRKQAVGVTMLVGNRKVEVVGSDREVILSAGAVATPQILLRSGVGPRVLLQNLKIPIVTELPVGMNLHDHLNMPLYVSIEKPVSVTLRKLLRVGTLWDYMVHARGPLASSGIVGVGTAPHHLGLTLFALGSPDERVLRGIANYRPETFRAMFPFSHDPMHEGFVFLATCLQPKSRGRIIVSSTDPLSQPGIDPCYLTQPFDVKCMIEAVMLAMEVVSSSPFKALGAKLHLPLLDECMHLEASPNNTAYLECMIRTASITGYHPGGSCKMGSREDPTTVVDPRLHVHNVDGLRVVDASVLPTPVSGHPNSILIAMAHKAAGMIL